MKKANVLFITTALFGVVISSSCFGKKNGNSDPRDITVWINEGDQYDGTNKDSVWKEIESKANVTLNVTGLTHNKSYYDTLANKFGTNTNIPDIVFMVPSDPFCSYSQLVENDMFWNIDELLLDKPGQYPYIEALLKCDTYKNIMYGDNLHTLIPNLTSHSGWTIYYRSDWLINVGYTQVVDGQTVARTPVTLDEFEDVMYKFTNNDPDKNGKNDTYAISPAGSNYFWNPIYHAFGVTTDYDLDSNNDVTYMCMQSEYREFLNWANKMYRAGTIDPQYFSNTINKDDRESFYRGNSGILITNGEEHVSYITTGLSQLQGKGKLTVGAAPIGTKTLGKEGAGGFSDWGGYWGGYSIYKDYKNGKEDYESAYAALDLLEYIYSKEGGLTRTFGIKGTHWDYDEAGNVKPLLSNRNDEPYDIFYAINSASGRKTLSGSYKMGHSWGNRVGWSDDMIPYACIDDCNIADSDKEIFNKTVSLNTLTTSKLVNLTGFSSSVTTLVNKFEDEMNQYANDCIKGSNSTARWNDELTRLNKTFAWSTIQQTMKELAVKRGLVK